MLPIDILSTPLNKITVEESGVVIFANGQAVQPLPLGILSVTAVTDAHEGNYINVVTEGGVYAFDTIGQQTFETSF